MYFMGSLSVKHLSVKAAININYTILLTGVNAADELQRMCEPCGEKSI